MKKRSFIAFALAVFFIGASLTVISATNSQLNGNNGGNTVTAPDGRVGANDVTGTFVPD